MEHTVVSRDAWLEARKAFLVKEKEFTRLRDQISQQRRDLPWERVEKEYVFEGPTGTVTLPELFAGKSQLIVYHFMFDPNDNEGCPHCSFWADNFDDLTPKGRDEAGQDNPQFWVRYHDRYDGWQCASHRMSKGR